MNEHLDIWVKARAFLAEERHWCRGTIAITIEGHHTLADDPKAVATCIGGAIIRAAGDRDLGIDAWRALAAVCEIEPAGFPARFNDTHEHPEILAVLDRGIALGRASRTLPSLLVVPVRELESVA